MIGALQAKADRHALVRSRVLDAARAIFEESGSSALSIRAIAQRAGMPPMTIYGYFPNKTAIVRALWSLSFDPLLAELQAAEAAHDQPKDRVRAVAGAFVGYWLRYPDRYRLVFLVEDRREQDQDRWFIEESDVVGALLRMAPMIAAARGDPALDCTREAEATICALIGLIHMRITVGEYPWPPIEEHVDVILRAVLCN